MTRELIPIPIESLEYAYMKSRTLEDENRKLRETNTELLSSLRVCLELINSSKYPLTDRAMTASMLSQQIIDKYETH